MTCCRERPSLRSMWMSETDSTMWICGRSASLMAPQTASMSAFTARASAVTMGPRTSRAMAWQAWKSPGEEIGNPASMTSTPSAASWCASCTLPSPSSANPGDCSPSRRVVSKM